MPRTRGWLLASLVLLALPGTAAAASRVPIPLGELIGGSSVIVLAVVKDVQTGGPPGSVLATLVVEQWLAGKSPASLVLSGSRTDDRLPHFEPGLRVLAFLAVDAQAPSGLRPVRGVSGIIPVPDTGLKATLELMTRALAQPGSAGLGAYRDLLTPPSGPAPAALLVALLVELRVHLSPNDEPTLAEIVCDAQEAFLPLARAWAVTASGRLRVTKPAACLAELASLPAPTSLRVLAISALGDLGDPGRLPVLLPHLSPAPSDPEDPPARLGGDSTLSAVLAAGKLRDPKAVPPLRTLALLGADLALHSTVVHALGLIGKGEALTVLDELAGAHPNALIRDQARRTRDRLTEGAGQ